MLVFIAAVLLGPSELRLAPGSSTPSAVNHGSSIDLVYGRNGNAYYRRAVPSGEVQVNSVAGTVHAANERGPKIAISSGGDVCVAWQASHMGGTHVWFARSTNGGRSFDDQRDLLQGKTPGADHVTVAASATGNTVGVFWIDGRGAKDAAAPVTDEIWYTISQDSGKTFGPNRKIQAQEPLRACACCSLDVHFTSPTSATLFYRGGKGNMREIWTAKGDAVKDEWKIQPLTEAKWELNACPMDGPRSSGAYVAYFMKGRCYLKTPDTTIDLGPGKYPSVLPFGEDTFVLWQGETMLQWRYLKSRESGDLSLGTGRATVVLGPNKRPLVIH
jgi:hypothetical protein